MRNSFVRNITHGKVQVENEKGSQPSSALPACATLITSHLKKKQASWRNKKGMHPTPRIAVCRFNNFIIDCLHNFMRR